MKATHSRWVRFCLASILAVTMAFVAKPVEACGCGIYLPLEGSASVNAEHVLIRWDGKTEDIVMTLGVLGSSKEAAVIFPVPTRATVKLADAEVFDVLQELTKPGKRYEVIIFPAMGGSPMNSVELLERQTLGSFDVSTLAASDANALGDWLEANGYNLPPEIVGALKPYVAEDWYFIAVRLSPGAGDDELTGALDPLWITFDYDQIVYPMRPSALAREMLTVFMYILADHRVEKTPSFGIEQIMYAGWLDPADLEADSPLAPFVTKKLFLTKIVEYIYSPEEINNDYVFQFASTDQPYRHVEYEQVCFVIPCSIGLVLLGCVLIIRRVYRKKQQLPKG